MKRYLSPLINFLCVVCSALAYQKLIEANGGQYITPIVWTSDMTSRARQYLRPQDYVIQIWTGATNYEVRELLQENYRLIFSNLDSLYLDHGLVNMKLIID